jgi:OPA family glycerol-3-phosphate transporter-like MFS transporter
VPAENVDSDYKRLRIQVFAGIFVGYAASYLIRKNFSLAIPDTLDAYPQYTKADVAGMVFSP